MNIVEVFGSVEEVEAIIVKLETELASLREQKDEMFRLGKTGKMNQLVVAVGDKELAVKEFKEELRKYKESQP